MVGAQKRSFIMLLVILHFLEWVCMSYMPTCHMVGKADRKKKNNLNYGWRQEQKFKNDCIYMSVNM